MLSALSFLTVFGRARRPGDTTLRWFPVIGALIGSVVAGVYWAAHEMWPPAVAGAIVLAADLVVTGALHLDGLADSADGLLAHLDRERRLAVMADPAVGAFATVTVVVVLLLRWSVLADPGIGTGAIVAVWAISRTAAAAVPAVMEYARPGGLAETFRRGASPWVLGWLVPLGAGLVVVSGWRGGAASVAAVIAPAMVLLLSQHRLGGFTGDVLGAAIVLSETVALVVLAVMP